MKQHWQVSHGPVEWKSWKENFIGSRIILILKFAQTGHPKIKVLSAENEYVCV